MKKLLLVVVLVAVLAGMIKIQADVPGGGGTPVGTCPCYDVGEVYSVGSWWQSGIYYTVTYTYIGGCQIRQDWYKFGVWFQQSTYAGGCVCECQAEEEPRPIDDPIW